MNIDTIQNFPLEWPPAWRRCHNRGYAAFSKTTTGSSNGVLWRRSGELSVADSIGRIREELRLMGISDDDFVVSTNMKPRLDGFPMSNQKDPADPGAAVYWRHGKDTRCMAIDRYVRVADNLAAIAATLDAMRLIKRHGGAEILDRAFIGFKMLPQAEQWWQVLGLKSDNVTAQEIEKAYLQLAKEFHPDKGGDGSKMARINAARDRGLEYIKEPK